MSDTAYLEVTRQTMAELLGTPEVAETDDLISMGGDSLTAIRLAMRLEESTGIELNVVDILTEPTPLGIAEQLRLAGPANAS
jgi:acyl carrier protein